VIQILESVFVEAFFFQHPSLSRLDETRKVHHEPDRTICTSNTSSSTALGTPDVHIDMCGSLQFIHGNCRSIGHPNPKPIRNPETYGPLQLGNSRKEAYQHAIARNLPLHGFCSPGKKGEQRTALPVSTLRRARRRAPTDRPLRLPSTSRLSYIII